MLSFTLTIGAVARNALSVALTSADCVGADTALAFDLTSFATFAVVATLFGLATSLGFGASQAAAGLNYLFGIPDGTPTQIALIIGITGLALSSVVAGLDAGVKRLSEFNMLMATLLMVFVIAVGQPQMRSPKIG